MFPFVSVDYQEGNVASYNGITATLDNREIARMNTGDFDKDYEILQRILVFLGHERWNVSSSVNHYQMDREPVSDEQEESAK